MGSWVFGAKMIYAAFMVGNDDAEKIPDRKITPPFKGGFCGSIFAAVIHVAQKLSFAVFLRLFCGSVLMFLVLPFEKTLNSVF
jgi:hypothetical protein